jgi:hypothetical protein
MSRITVGMLPHVVAGEPEPRIIQFRKGFGSLRFRDERTAVRQADVLTSQARKDEEAPLSGLAQRS